MFTINKLMHAFLMGLLLSFSIIANAEPVNALLRQGGDPVVGNPNGKVTIVEFFDYQCGHCVSMAPVMSAIIKANPDVRVVYKELPIRGSNSQFASRAALAAKKQGKYYALSHAMLVTNEPLNETTVMELAKKAGLNITKLKKDMNDKSITNQIDANMKLAQDLQISGTPAFFIGRTDATSSDEVVFRLGEMSQRELQDVINKIKA